MKRALAAAAAVLLAGASSTAAAKRAPARFRVSLTASFALKWSEQQTGVDAQGCSYVRTGGGETDFQIKSRHPTTISVVRSSGGVVYRPAVLRGLDADGTVAGAPIYTQSSQCGWNMIGDPGPPQPFTLFRNGRVTLGRPRAGALLLARLSFVGPPDALPWPEELGPPPIPLDTAVGQVDESKLLDRRTRRIVVAGTGTRQVRVVGDVTGQVAASVQWKLTFTRVR